MEEFSEEHSKLLYSKEWLVKIDKDHSIPYMMKFYSSLEDTSCFVIITDTKSVWFEEFQANSVKLSVLSSNQFMRRWHSSNAQSNVGYSEADEGVEWRTKHLALVTILHTLGAVADSSFEIFSSNYCDLAFELECDTFKWRWQTNFVGYKMSSEIISRHLIMPLISVNHLIFASTEPISEMSEDDLEKAIDRVGRGARRTIDTHIRNAIAKPRVATTLRRMSAIFNFVSELPAVVSTVEKPLLDVPEPKLPAKAPTTLPSETHFSSVSADDNTASLSKLPTKSGHNTKHTEPPFPVDDKDSTTEESENDDLPDSVAVTVDVDPSSPTLQLSRATKSPSAEPNTRSNPEKKVKSDTESESDSSPVRPPAKKKKLDKEGSSDSDSEDCDNEIRRKRRLANAKIGTVSTGARRGTKQPVKRGGRKF